MSEQTHDGLPIPFREEQALREVGQTQFSPGVAVALIVFFSIMLASGSLIQFVVPHPHDVDRRSETATAAKSPSELFTGTILRVSSRPPSDAVYQEFVIQLLVENLTDASGETQDEECLVNVLAMKGGELLPIVHVQPGDLVRFSLTEEATPFSGLNASFLEGDAFITMRSRDADLAILENESSPSESARFLHVWTEPSPVLREDEQDRGPFKRFLASNQKFLHKIKLYEETLDETATLGLAMRPHIQSLLTLAGAGNEEAVVGSGGWIFYAPDIRSLTEKGFLESDHLKQRILNASPLKALPQPDPRLAILHFHRQLADLGIELVLMPTPVKPTIHPEMLTSRASSQSNLIRNSSFDLLVADLGAAGVPVFDPGELLKERASEEVQYLATDTHWTPDAMQAVASALAEHIGPYLSNNPSVEWKTSLSEHTQLGDAARMLDLASWQRAILPETITVTEVQFPDSELWKSDPKSEILLLGDSFTNIFSLGEMGWGSGAGLAEHLSLALGGTVDRFSQNDAGAFATRDLLVRELQRDPNRLAHKKVVIWQFAERELHSGDWRLLSLPDSTVGPAIEATVSQDTPLPDTPPVEKEPAMNFSSTGNSALEKSDEAKGKQAETIKVDDDKLVSGMERVEETPVSFTD